MSKTAIIITIAAAYFAAVSHGLPAPKVVNWAEVSAKVGEIQNVVVDAANQVKSIASTDNEVVGSSVGSKVDLSLDASRVILERVNAAIEAETLTAAEARTEVGNVKGGIGKLIGSLQADLAQLNPIAAVQIRQIFSATFDTIDLRAAELQALLQQ